MTTLPDVYSWAVGTYTPEVDPGDTVEVYVDVSTGDGYENLPIYFEVHAFGTTRKTSTYYQPPRTTRRYYIKVPVPTYTSPGTYSIGVTLYKGTEVGEAPPGAI